MILSYLLLLGLVLYKTKWRSCNAEYLSFDCTNAVKGFFIVLVFISHFNAYLITHKYGYDGWGDELFKSMTGDVGQWIVASFLFYSGYGVMESIRKKGMGYVWRLPRHRILTVLVNFDIAVLCYFFLGMLMGKVYDVGTLLLSFVAWESVGNPTWYIFVIVVCYCMTYLSFGLLGRWRWAAVLLCVALCVGAMFVIAEYKPSWWYDTLLCYPAGVVFSYGKWYFEVVLRKVSWLLLVGGVLVLVGLNYFEWIGREEWYNVFAIFLALFVVVVTYRVQVKSPVLVWLGKHLFALYVYQHVAMQVLFQLGIGVEAPVAAFVLAAGAAVGIAYLQRYCDVRL